MNKKKHKICFEIIHNCPFLSLLLLTAVVGVLFFDVGKVYKTDRRATVSQVIGRDKNAEKENDNGTDAVEETLKNKRTADGIDTKNAEGDEGYKGEFSENAGARKDTESDITDKLNRKSVDINAKVMENREKTEKRATEFAEYTPIEINSRYYSDAGKVALTTAYDYSMENESYFNDAAFFGDSRTLGISDYAGLEGADFFCDNGMTIYKLLEDKGVTFQKTGEKVDVKKVLQEKTYRKIYIMLGMNELGYGDTSMYLKQYYTVIRQMQEWQPEAVIFIMANLHVSREKNNMETEFNNININDKNAASARLANGKDVFYLDCNPLFTDEEGYLQEELTFDGVHLYAQHYDKWRDFLFAHGVEKEEVQKAEANVLPEDFEGAEDSDS